MVSPISMLHSELLDTTITGSVSSSPTFQGTVAETKWWQACVAAWSWTQSDETIINNGRKLQVDPCTQQVKNWTVRMLILYTLQLRKSYLPLVIYNDMYSILWQDSYELRHVKKGAIYGWCYSNSGMLKFRYAFNEDKNEKRVAVFVCAL